MLCHFILQLLIYLSTYTVKYILGHDYWNKDVLYINKSDYNNKQAWLLSSSLI